MGRILGEYLGRGLEGLRSGTGQVEQDMRERSRLLFVILQFWILNRVTDTLLGCV